MFSVLLYHQGSSEAAQFYKKDIYCWRPEFVCSTHYYSREVEVLSVRLHTRSGDPLQGTIIRCFPNRSISFTPINVPAAPSRQPENCGIGLRSVLSLAAFPLRNLCPNTLYISRVRQPVLSVDIFMGI